MAFDTSDSSVDYSGGSAAALGNYIADCYIEIRSPGWGKGAYLIMDNAYYEPVNPAIEPFEPGNPNIIDHNRWQPISLPVAIDQSGNPVNSEPEFLGA